MERTIMEKLWNVVVILVMFLGVGLMVTQAYLITHQPVDPDLSAPTVCVECHKVGR